MAQSDQAVTPDKVFGLFNGKDLSNWEPDVPAKDTNPNAPASFIIRNGMLVSMGEPQGHLVTKQVYRDYRLEAEYRFPGKPGNCGILVHASKPRALYKMFPQSIEVQMMSGDAGDFWCIQENIEVPDMETRRPKKAGEKWGGAEGDARRILNLTDNSEKPLGQWNTMIIEARGPLDHRLGQRRPREQRHQRQRGSRARLPSRPKGPRSSSERCSSARCRRNRRRFGT